MSDRIVTVILAVVWALAATYFLTEVVRQRPFRRPFARRASRPQSLALALLCAGLALNPTAALLRDHRTFSIALSVLGLLCLAGMLVVFAVQGWNSQQDRNGRSGGLDRTEGDHPGDQARSVF